MGSIDADLRESEKGGHSLPRAIREVTIPVLKDFEHATVRAQLCAISVWEVEAVIADILETHELCSRRTVCCQLRHNIP